MHAYQPQRPIKPEENYHRPLGSNLIGVLIVSNPGRLGMWTASASCAGLTLNRALVAQLLTARSPLLWAMRSTVTGYEFKFGFDLKVPALRPGIGMQPEEAKIGHVGLTSSATISGEIIQMGGAWELDNNSGAWGSMSNQDGKSNMLHCAAQMITACDPGGIDVRARKAYSRVNWKRVIQQRFR